MIQAFYTVASGMQAQQQNIDVISNNISNINTPGYRIKRAEFEELLDSQMQNQQNNEVIIAGHGTKIANVSTMPLPDDVNPFGLAISGEGYFVLEDANGNRAYSKDGNFKLLQENNRYYLATKEDNFVLDRNYNRIELSPNPDDLIVTGGALYPQGNHGEQGIVPAVVRFDRNAELGIRNKDYFVETELSGSPYLSTTSSVTSNYLDELAPLAMTNQINEITKLVQTQMAYQINSKALQVVDEMEGMVNHLRY